MKIIKNSCAGILADLWPGGVIPRGRNSSFNTNVVDELEADLPYALAARGWHISQ